MQNEACTHPQDLQTARQIAAGDADSLTRFYEQWTGPLYAFIYNQIERNKMEAEEVLQEVWLAALHGIGAYNGQSGLFTWLCSIAQHKISDHYRKLGRLQRLETDTSAEVIDALNNDTLLPEDVLSRQSTRLLVVTAMAALPHEYRQALTARYANECSVDQVAAMLKKSYKATESLLTRARTALRDAVTHLEASHDG